MTCWTAGRAATSASTPTTAKNAHGAADDPAGRGDRSIVARARPASRRTARKTTASERQDADVADGVPEDDLAAGVGERAGRRGEDLVGPAVAATAARTRGAGRTAGRCRWRRGRARGRACCGRRAGTSATARTPPHAAPATIAAAARSVAASGASRGTAGRARRRRRRRTATAGARRARRTASPARAARAAARIVVPVSRGGPVAGAAAARLDAPQQQRQGGVGLEQREVPGHHARREEPRAGERPSRGGGADARHARAAGRTGT